MHGVDDPVPVYRMGGRNRSYARRRYLRSRRLRGNRRAVVAVVGTLLALLVFFALFGIFLTQYVPLWMTDNESQFTSQTSASFAQFKSNLDQQYLLDGPPTYGTPFTISSQGVPLIAQPTQGTLSFLPTTCPSGFSVSKSTGIIGQPMSPGYCVFQNLTLTVGPGGSGVYSQHVASGVLQMQLPNRYYNGQTFYFENDAVVQSQGGFQQVLALPPPFNVSTVGGVATVGSNTSVVTSFLQLYGNASTVVGQGTEQVYSHLRFSDTVTSNGRSGGSSFALQYEIGTQYPFAWQRYFLSMMNASGLSPAANPTQPFYYYNWSEPCSSSAWFNSVGGLRYVTTNGCTTFNGATTVLNLTLMNVNYATVFYAGAQVALGIGGT